MIQREQRLTQIQSMVLIEFDNAMNGWIRDAMNEHASSITVDERVNRLVIENIHRKEHRSIVLLAERHYRVPVHRATLPTYANLYSVKVDTYSQHAFVSSRKKAVDRLCYLSNKATLVSIYSFRREEITRKRVLFLSNRSIDRRGTTLFTCLPGEKRLVRRVFLRQAEREPSKTGFIYKLGKFPLLGLSTGKGGKKEGIYLLSKNGSLQEMSACHRTHLACSRDLRTTSLR